ncbi:unnamed protein product [Closterium sp. NIES-64]|nr:unnamed protein product [Closterium sp. NIES-64]
MRKVTESRGNSRFGSIVYKTQEGLEAPLLGDKAAAGRGDSDSDTFYGKDVERAAGGVGGAGEAERAKGIRGEEEYRRIENRGNSGYRHSLNAIRHGASRLAGSPRAALFRRHLLLHRHPAALHSPPSACCAGAWTSNHNYRYHHSPHSLPPRPSPFPCAPPLPLRCPSPTGIGILSTPYATAQAGWLGLLVLLFFAAACCYTAILLRRCMDFRPSSSASAFPSDSSLRSFADDPAAPHSAASARASARASPRIVRAQRPIRSYPDIGEAAFGRAGRWLTAFLLYFELYAVTVELLILEGDNLAHLFPSGDICLLPGSLVGKGSSGKMESGGEVYWRPYF